MLLVKSYYHYCLFKFEKKNKKILCLLIANRKFFTCFLNNLRHFKRIILFK